MADEEKKTSLDDLSTRLANAQHARKGPAGREPDAEPSNSGMGQAFRIGTDMIAALLVGTFIGWYLDKWLDTKPWFTIVFIFLGGAAGILNVYRTGMRMVDEVEDELKNEAEKGLKEADSADSDKKES